MSDIVLFGNGAVTLKAVGNIGVLVLDNPPVNALSRAVRTGMLQALNLVRTNSALDALVLMGAGRGFCGGADITEFRKGEFFDPDINDLACALEELNKPTVAAIHGTALGGGLEIAMACRLRIAASSAKLGLPEVNLGVLPGGGGTQRLPRLIGAVDALEMILSGAAISAATALERGLIDAIVEGELQDEAVRFACQAVSFTKEHCIDGQALLPVSAMPVNTAGMPSDFFRQARQGLANGARGMMAHARIIDCIEAAVSKPFVDGLKFEQEQFLACNRSPEAAALQHLFFAEREAARIPGLPEKLALRPIARVGIVGAGTMGGGIAMNFLNAGIPVTLSEISQESLERGLAIIRANYEATARKGKLTMAQVEQRLGLLTGTIDYHELGNCDLVIEAVFENMAVKKTVCAKLGQVCKPGAIIATNTSTLDVDVLAKASGRPADFLGMHFFSPAHVMRLLEVVRGGGTAPDVLATVMALGKTIGKVAVVSGVCYGFIGNRMLESYLREAEFLLLEGATPQKIDGALERFGMVMGPLRMMDLAGVDVCAKIVMERRVTGALANDPAYRVTSEMLFHQGRFGQKSGSGYYLYDGRQHFPDPEVDALIAGLARQHGVVRRARIGDEEIVERCLYPLINEGCKILEEGIAYRAGDIDVVFQHGYGFPRLLGGPMHYGETRRALIRERLLAYGRVRGDAFGYWTPARTLTDASTCAVKVA